jgi:hypothetical protein
MFINILCVFYLPAAVVKQIIAFIYGITYRLTNYCRETNFRRVPRHGVIKK